MCRLRVSKGPELVWRGMKVPSIYYTILISWRFMTRGLILGFTKNPVATTCLEAEYAPSYLFQRAVPYQK